MQPIAKIPYPDLNDPDGNNPLANVARAVRDVACSLPPGPLGGEGAPLGWLRDGLRRSWGCPPPPPPPPNVDRPYNTPQGKCPGAIIRFDVPYSYTIIRPGEPPQPFSSVAGMAQFPTPIVNVRESRVGGGISFFGDVGVQGTASYRQNILLANVPVPAPEQITGLQYQVNMVPISGDPDNCSNPSPTYPPPPQRDSPNAPAPFVIPPIIIVPIRPEISVPVTIAPNFTINGGINFRVADSIDIQLGPDAVNIYINPDSGIDLFPDAPEPGFQLPPGFPDPPTGNGGSEGANGDCPEADLSEVIEKLDDLRECACDEPSDVDYVSNVVATGDNGSILLDEDVIAVRLTLTEFPRTPKTESGGGIAPSVYYAGWSSFTGFGGQTSRNPIDYAEKTYYRQKTDVAFTWTCRQGYSADIQVIRAIPL